MDFLLVNVFLHLHFTKEVPYGLFILDVQLHFTIGVINKESVQKILETPWAGSNYSKRIWKRGYIIAQKAREGVVQNILAGTSVNRVTDQLAKELKIDNQRNLYRLIYTETSYVKGQADLLAYKYLGMEEYQILATLDGRASNTCRRLDGKHFKLSEAVVGKTYPPFHPNCRTTTIRYKEQAEGTRSARGQDGKVYQVPAGLSYKDWFKRYVKKDDFGYNINNKKLYKITEYASSIEITKRVKDGLISLTSNHEHCEKHKLGTKQYESYLQSRKKRNWGPQNRLTISEEEAQKLIYDCSGTGIPYHGKNNMDKWYEDLNVHQHVGYYVYQGIECPTAKIRIYYGKKGTHIIPIKGDYFD